MTDLQVEEPAAPPVSSSAPAAVLDALPPFLVALHELFDEPHVVGSLLVLGALEQHGPLRASELAGAIGLAPSTLSRKLTYLQGKGWLSTSPAPDDGRGIVVQTTPEGSRYLSALREQLTGRLGRHFVGWTEDELGAFATYLGRCRPRSAPAPTAASRKGRTAPRGDR